jgi:hypothetical protein
MNEKIMEELSNLPEEEWTDEWEERTIAHIVEKFGVTKETATDHLNEWQYMVEEWYHREAMEEEEMRRQWYEYEQNL